MCIGWGEYTTLIDFWCGMTSKMAAAAVLNFLAGIYIYDHDLSSILVYNLNVNNVIMQPNIVVLFNCVGLDKI